jgi:zinc/manganese transport system substrate-binding protein
MGPEARMGRSAAVLPVIVLCLTVLLAGCQKEVQAAKGKRTIVATYTVLASVAAELVGGSFDVKALIPNGQDPHEWEPSARDMEALNKADLIVQNGLGLEGGMEKALKQAADVGVKVFVAADSVQVRTVGKGEGIPSGDADQALGAPDPHLWLDPLSMKAVADGLAARIRTDFGVDVSDRAAALDARLDALDAEIRAMVGAIPADRRKLVTGHESMGYYARRYGFTLIGAIIPSLTTQAEVSASDMAALKRLIAGNGVGVVFTELGTPAAVAEALAREAGVRSVALSTHSLPPDGSYFTFERNLTALIVGGLK